MPKPSGMVHDDASIPPGGIAVSQHQAALAPVVDLLTRLSPSNVRLVEKIVRCVLDEQDTEH